MTSGSILRIVNSMIRHPSLLPMDRAQSKTFFSVGRGTQPSPPTPPLYPRSPYLHGNFTPVHLPVHGMRMGSAAGQIERQFSLRRFSDSVTSFIGANSRHHSCCRRCCNCNDVTWRQRCAGGRISRKCPSAKLMVSWVTRGTVPQKF